MPRHMIIISAALNHSNKHIASTTRYKWIHFFDLLLVIEMTVKNIGGFGKSSYFTPKWKIQYKFEADSLEFVMFLGAI